MRKKAWRCSYRISPGVVEKPSNCSGPFWPITYATVSSADWNRLVPNRDALVAICCSTTPVRIRSAIRPAQPVLLGTLPRSDAH